MSLCLWVSLSVIVGVVLRVGVSVSVTETVRVGDYECQCD